jgi:hypothetical protein
MVITDERAIGDCGMGSKYFITLCKYRRICPSVIATVITNGIYLSVIMAWVVIFVQLLVKYWRLGAVCKAVGIDLKYFKKIVYY